MGGPDFRYSVTTTTWHVAKILPEPGIRHHRGFILQRSSTAQLGEACFVRWMTMLVVSAAQDKVSTKAPSSSHPTENARFIRRDAQILEIGNGQRCMASHVPHDGVHQAQGNSSSWGY